MGTSAKPEPTDETVQEGEDKQSGPQLDPLAMALAEARQRQKAGESIMPPDEDKAGEKDDKADEEDPDAEANEDVVADAEEEAEAEAEGEDAEDEDEQKGGEAEDVSAEAEEAEEGEEDEEPDPDLIVGLPPRREGDPEFEIVAETKEGAERLRHLKNMAVRGEELQDREEATQRDLQQIEELEVFIGTDPVGFILQNVPEATIDTVTMSLVLDPKILSRIQDRLFPALQDEKERRAIAAELRGERAEAKNALRETIEVRRYAKTQAKIVKDGIAKMVPVTEGISDERRAAIIESLEKAATQKVREKKLDKIELDDLPVLLGTELRAAGLDPLSASQALRDGGNSEPGKKGPAKKKPKRPTAKELKQASAKRKRAAAATPTGGSAPAASPKLPVGQNLEDRMKLVREKGIGALMGK